MEIVSKAGMLLVVVGLLCTSVGVTASEPKAPGEPKAPAVAKIPGVTKVPAATNAPAMTREQLQARRAYNLALVEQEKALREKRAKLQTVATAAQTRKATMLKSNPECAKLVVEIAALEEELAAKQKRLNDLLGNDPELKRLSKEIDKAEGAVKADRAAIQESIRQRMKREWGAE